MEQYEHDGHEYLVIDGNILPLGYLQDRKDLLIEEHKQEGYDHPHNKCHDYSSPVESEYRELFLDKSFPGADGYIDGSIGTGIEYEHQRQCEFAGVHAAVEGNHGG